MCREHLKLSIVFAVIAINIVVLSIGGGAVAPAVEFMVNPQTKITYSGSGKIEIAEKTLGSDFMFILKLNGLDEFVDEGTTVLYTFPEKMRKKSVQTTVTVTVTDEKGQKTTETLTFTILAKPGRTPVPIPALEPTLPPVPALEPTPTPPSFLEYDPASETQKRIRRPYVH